MPKTPPLNMNLGERMAILAFAGKCLEMLGADSLVYRGVSPTDMSQLEALAKNAKPIMARLDRDSPAMLPMPHDGVPWSKRK